MGKHWKIQPHDAGRIANLARLANISEIVAQLLIARGTHDPEEAREFLAAKLSGLRDPSELPGIRDAAERVFAAVRGGEQIWIYGDYDADGMTATAILVRCLKSIGGKVRYYVPHRLEEGYGLNDTALRTLRERGADLVITVDCGIASIHEARTARELGLDLIVTDHHEMAEQLPDATVLVHPRLPGTDYPFAGLCGAGVAFKLAWALCQLADNSEKVGNRLREFLLSAMGLAAIGTVADVVPLIDENRLIVRHGLSSLKHRPSPGLGALMAMKQLDRKPMLTSEDIGFMLAPRLNAAGRLGQAALGVELLVTDSMDRAEDLAKYIHELNGNRETLERSIYLAANKQVKDEFDPANDPALVVAGRGWHPGVIGIVAGRLAEKYSRPVVLIALDELGKKVASGSARSANGLNLHRALAACDEHLVSHGGHAAAAGLRIDEAHLDKFRAHFCEHVSEEVAPEDRVAQVRIDAEAPLSQLTLKTVQEMEQLAPFGNGNPRPLLYSKDVVLNGPPKKMGAGERHLSLRIKQFNTTLRAIAFGQAEWAEPLERLQSPFEIAFRPVINEYRGMRSVEAHLVDWRKSEVAIGAL